MMSPLVKDPFVNWPFCDGSLCKCTFLFISYDNSFFNFITCDFAREHRLKDDFLDLKN